MKKRYEIPSMKVKNMLTACSFAEGVNSIESNVDLEIGGGSSEDGRAREFNDETWGCDWGSVWEDVE
ncbi:MAG: hypothetical protein IJ605_06275 [Prevotella sp.]|nr:hypothetical protein [Prevotella sp.]